MGLGYSVCIKDIVNYLKYKQYDFVFDGDIDSSICGFSSLANYKYGTITWMKKSSALDFPVCDIQLCVVQQGIDVKTKSIIIAEQSKAIFFDIIEHFFEESDKDKKSIGDNTVIGKNVVLEEDVCIGNNCSIFGNIRIGKGTVISDNVVIKNNVTIGERCHIQALTVIGEDGFGYSEDSNNIKTMVKHHGGVRIGNDVFIGSHVNVARGTIDDTVIGNGVKIAPSTHIGHNNIIGDNATVICSQLYGSVNTGENAYIVGSIIRNQCVVGNDSMIGMGSVVTKDIPEKKVAIGCPAKVIKDKV